MLESHSHFLKAQRQKKSFKPKLQPLFFYVFGEIPAFRRKVFHLFLTLDASG